MSSQGFGRRSKADARRRLAEIGLEPGFLPEEAAAAYMTMSPNTFMRWIDSDPTAPQPVYIGDRVKRFRVADLDASGRSARTTQAA